jgi:hypothetical protein
MRIENRERPAEQARAAPDAEQLSAVDDVLDHLLDPLEDVVPDPGADAVHEAAPAHRWPPPQPIVLGYEDGGGWVRDFAARVRWSQRSQFRIPRLLAGWTLLAALFCGVVWLIVSSGGLR